MKHSGNGTLPRLVCLAAITFGLLLVSTVHRANAHTAQNAQVKLNVEAGYDGYYRSDRWLPLLVTVSNSGPDIVGELRVTASGTPGLSAGSYTTSVEFPNGSNKELFLYITLAYGTTQVKVELANDSGIIADETRPLKTLFPSDLLYAMITESPAGNVDLQSVRTGMGDVHQINWRIDNLPPNANALQSLDVMVLTDVDTGKFSAEQRQAISDWARSGGHLIVTGGPNWQKTQAGLTYLLPFTPTGNTTLTSLPSLANFAGHTGDKLEAPSGSPIVLAQGTPTQAATILVQESGVPLLTRQKYGAGIVDYMALDPGLEPFPSWKNRNQFWLTVLTTTGQLPSWASGVVDTNAAQQAANLIKGVRLPDVFQLLRFLGLYILIIGPVNYLVLRWLKRPELAWVTIPIIIIATSVLAYLTGFSLRGTQATINRIALVQVWPGSDRAQVDGVIGVLAPRRAIYTITAQSGLTLRTMESVDNSGGSVAPTDSGPTIWQYPNYEVRDVPVDAGLMAVFASRGTMQATSIDGSATLEMPAPDPRRVNVTAPRVTGTVKNTTGLTLENAVVLVSGGSQSVGTLNPGDSVNFDFAASPAQGNDFQSAPFSLGGGAASRFAGGNGNGTQDMTVRDIMGMNYLSNYYYGGYSFGYGDNNEQQEFRRRQAFLRAVTEDVDASGGRGDAVYLAGWTSTSPLDVSLKGAAFVTEDSTLYIYRLPVTIKQTNDVVAVPLPFLTWIPTSDSVQRQLTPYGINLQPGDKIAFRYNPLPLLRLKEVTQLDIEVKATSYRQGIISLWDWTESKWVDIGVNSTLTNVSDPQRFLGPENAIQVQVEPAPGVSLLTFDRVDVLVNGRLVSAAGS
ncbi:MAG: hypothetical protein ABI947_27805 [Chloroflexota bacterium]